MVCGSGRLFQRARSPTDTLLRRAIEYSVSPFCTTTLAPLRPLELETVVDLPASACGARTTLLLQAASSRVRPKASQGRIHSCMPRALIIAPGRGRSIIR